MTTTRRLTGLLTSAAAMTLMLGLSAPAEAYTCASACSQVQRACKQQSKAGWDQARYACDQEALSCAAGCEANADTCAPDCDAAAAVCNGSCADAPDPAACSAGCAAAQDTCLFACENCEALCGDARDACRDQAKADRSAARDGCATARQDCLGVCVDPIDGDCVRGCKNDERGCGASAKRNYGQCKTDCSRGTARRACTKQCKNGFAAAQEACSNATVLCIAGPTPSCIAP